MHTQHLRQKHMMRAEFFHFCHTALDIYRAFPNQRGCQVFCRRRGQMHLLKFIHIPSGTDAAIVGSPRQLPGRQVYHKLPRLSDNIIRISLRAHGNIHHSRIRTHRTRPCYSQDIGTLPPPAAAYHYRRKRINHISCLPGFLLHC